VIENQSNAGAPVPGGGRSGVSLPVFVLVVVAAVFLRFWNLGSAGISHWDAGTYTAGPLGVGPYGQGEIVLFQTPPLVPRMFAALFAFWAPVDTLAMGAIALFGVATVVALFFAGRRWVGDAPALAGAAALAGMQFHLLFSRQALTDVPFAFFLLLAAWAFTAAVERASILLSLLCGLAAGAAILTKYHGFLALVVPVSWLLLLRGRRSHDEEPLAGGAGSRCWRAWLVACAVAAVPAAWLAWEIERKLGFAAFLRNHSAWLSEPGLYLIPQAIRLVARSLWEWVSPFALAPALLGFIVMGRRRARGDLLVLAWTGLFLAVIPCYRFYPRLLVPLLLPLALAAGVGLDALARRIAPGWRRGRTALLALAALAPGAWSSRATLALEDRGYELAARFLAQAPRDPRPDVLVTQHAILFYLLDVEHPFLCYDQPEAIDALENGRFRYLVGDLRLLHAPEFREYIETHRVELKLVAEIGNPMPESTIVNCAGFEGLDALRSSTTSPEERATLETIRVWRLVRPDGR
jgi:4-amino-4-deoxy-L-arabinose transferase-like glycosyltransferase